jgi:hypothetical protein
MTCLEGSHPIGPRKKKKKLKGILVNGQSDMIGFDASQGSLVKGELGRALAGNYNMKKLEEGEGGEGVARNIKMTNKEFDRLKYDRPGYKKLTEYLSKEKIKSRSKIKSFLEDEWIGRLNGVRKNFKS